MRPSPYGLARAENRFVWNASGESRPCIVPRGGGGGRSGHRRGYRGWSFTIENALFNNIQAPVQHWAPTPGRNLVSATGSDRVR